MSEKPCAEPAASATRQVTLRGDVDMINASAATAKLLAAVEGDVQRVVVDLSRITFLGVSGLRALLAANEAARGHEIQLVLSGCSPMVLRMLDITGIRDEFLFVSGRTRR